MDLFFFKEGVSLRLLNRLSQKLNTPAVIFCGDFNTTPDFAPYEFLRDGSLSKETIQKLANRKIEDMQKKVQFRFRFCLVYPRK